MSAVSSRRAWLPAAVLAAVTFAAYLPALDGPFTYDDRIEVVGNPSIRSLDEPLAILRYNPGRVLVVASYAVNFALGAFDPRGYHLVSAAIHALNAVLAAGLARRALERAGVPDPALRGWLAGALWALHPMCSEGAAYVAGRSDALCATFWLLALSAWLDGRLRAALLSAAAAVATKEVAFALPLALLAADGLLPHDADRTKARARILTGLLGLLLVAAALRTSLMGWPRPEVPRDATTHVLTQAEAWTTLARLWVLPVGQSVLHDLPARAAWQGAVALVVWIAAAVLALRAGRLVRFAFVLWSAALLPASVLPLKETMAEHRAYLAGLGPILLLVAAVPRPRAAFALVAPLLAATLLRARLWSDEAALWGAASDANPVSRDAAYGWGDALRLARRHAEAEPAYRRALDARPEDVDARINLGITLAEQGRSEEARAEWMRVLRAAPRTCPAHNNLAALDLREGRAADAIAGWRTTLRWCPDDTIAHLALGNLLSDQGDTRAAAYHLRAFVDRAPADHPQVPTARRRLQTLGVLP